MKMNITMKSWTKGMFVRGLLVAACIIYVGMQPSPAFAGNVNAPGTVTAWGSNGYGQLGNGTTTNSSTPVSVILSSGVTASAIAAGALHSLAITNDGVYAWGVNTEGELGDGTITNRTVPVKVNFPPAVTSVSAISSKGLHSLALTNDGLYAWGYNGSGQLGDGTTSNRTVPVKVIFPPEVTTLAAISTGFYHSLAITNDGLYAWGTAGTLGNGTTNSSSKPVKVAFPPAVTSVVAISGGGFHSLAITNDGPYAWGNNTFGQLGDGTTTVSTVPVKTIFPNPVKTVTAISAGFWYSLAITDNGPYAWGDNSSGVLGVGTTVTSSNVPLNIKFPKAVTRVKALTAGEMHSLAITNDGLYSWGSNAQGELGIVGKNKYTPTKVPGESNAIAMAAGYYHSLALH